MGNTVNCSLYGLLMIFFFTSFGDVNAQQKDLPASSTQGQCSSGCLRCEIKGCVKCRDVIIFGTRECLERCPSGFIEDWSTRVDYMGRLCTEKLGTNWLSSTSSSASSGLKGRWLAVVIGALSGVGLCILILMAACAWIACTRASRRSPPPTRVLRTDNLPDHCITPQEAQKRREFAKQVAALRPEAPVFLAMLNDTRRKIRQVYRPNGTDSRSKAYRTVLGDLTRLLTILNRREERLGAPPQDWAKLLAWAERSLRRYKNSCSSACSSGAGSSTSSTPSSSHALTQLPIPVEVQPTHSIIQLPLPPDCGAPLRQNDSIEVPALLQSSAEWSQHAALASYYESCGFYPLGHRPQDEITTEL